MIGLILTAMGPPWSVLAAAWSAAQPAPSDPSTELIRSGYAQLGFLALLLGLGWWVIRQEQKRAKALEDSFKERLIAVEAVYQDRLAAAEARTDAALARAVERENDSRAVRDVFIRDLVPTMTLQSARFEQLLEGFERVVGVVERVMNNFDTRK